MDDVERVRALTEDNSGAFEAVLNVYNELNVPQREAFLLKLETMKFDPQVLENVYEETGRSVPPFYLWVLLETNNPPTKRTACKGT